MTAKNGVPVLLAIYHHIIYKVS